MFLVNISLKSNNDDEQTVTKRFELHRQWFADHFKNGTFLMLGPYLDKEHSGVIVAQSESREALELVLAQDVYYPLGLANYEVHEFKPVMISEYIVNYVGK